MIQKALISYLSICAAVIFPAAVNAANTASDGEIAVAGRVTDEEKTPIKNVLVTLTGENGQISSRTHTDKSGHFTIMQANAGQEVLRVIPPNKTGFAQAVLIDIPGDEGRHVLISLHRGFLVRGRVMSNKQPLKHITVRVESQDGDAVHGGGETMTNGHGQFELVLTPGRKSLKVTGIKDPSIVAEKKQNYNVTGDATIPDINVPGVRTAGKIR